MMILANHDCFDLGFYDTRSKRALIQLWEANRKNVPKMKELFPAFSRVTVLRMGKNKSEWQNNHILTMQNPCRWKKYLWDIPN